MMEGDEPVLHYSDINTSLRVGELPALGWRSDFISTLALPFH